MAEGIFVFKEMRLGKPVSKDEGLNILEGYVKVFMLFPHREDIVSGVWPVNNDIPLVQVKAGLTIEKALYPVSDQLTAISTSGGKVCCQVLTRVTTR